MFRNVEENVSRTKCQTELPQYLPDDKLFSCLQSWPCCTVCNDNLAPGWTATAPIPRQGPNLFRCSQHNSCLHQTPPPLPST